MIGGTVSHYRILERLGGGGMGVVYLADDTRLDRQVALKFLPIEWSSDQELRERFTREARASSALDHPHICTIYEIDETPEGQLFIAMTYCPGETLKQRIRRGPLPTDEALAFAIQIAEALQAAHQHGVVHRDVKPANILITDQDQVKVVDFGLAKLAGEAAVTRDGAVMGTPAYMSPEQAKGEDVDGRSDLWALGVVLYEMLTGRRAFAADHERAVLLAITTTDPTPVDTLRSDVPAELLRILRRCLKRNPEKRYQNAGELLADLGRFGGAASAAEIVTQTLPSLASVRRRRLVTHRVLPIAAAVAAVVLAAVFYPILDRPQQRHLLVLPFNCPAVDTESQLMCIGLLDTVTAKLAELRRFRSSLSVVPASEVRAGRVSSAEMAHHIFGVDLVVSGSVLQESDLVRIPVQLVDAAKRRQVRSRTITGEKTADFVLQDRVVATIEDMLDLELGAVERQAMRAGGTSSAEAAGLFLEARGRTTTEPSEDQLTRAMTLYRQALELDPDYAEAMVQLADACGQRFELSEDPIWLEHGMGYARRAVELAPDLPPAHFAAGRFALDTGSYQAAVEHLQRTLALDPLNIRAYVYLADAFKAAGDPEQAEETLERAVRTGPIEWVTHQNIGRLYFERGEWELAAGYFRRVIELLPDSSIGYTSLGGCSLYLGDLGAARENLERAVEIGSGYWAYSNLATLEYWEGNYQPAAGLYRQALEMDDSDYQVWNNLGEVLRQQEPPDLGGALTAYRRAEGLAAARLEVTPNDVRLLIDLASYRVQLGDEAAARGLLARILSLDITDPQQMFDLASVYEELGERDQAVEWLGRALEAGFPLDLIESYPVLAALVEDPHFVKLAEKYGEPQAETTEEDPDEETKQ
ncbi:MAG: protein kinase [Acidobacteria bacterium]|nr:protein kinase [Acidobacteriota bacterium]